MTKVLAGFGLLWFLVACTPVDAVRSTAADAFDSALVSSENVTCNDSSIGAIKRRYGQTEEGIKRWIAWCFPHGVIRDALNDSH